MADRIGALYRANPWRIILEQMWTPVHLDNDQTHEYGFGWEIGTLAAATGLSRMAATFSTGFSHQIDRFVDDHLTVIVLTNLANSLPGRTAYRRWSVCARAGPSRLQSHSRQRTPHHRPFDRSCPWQSQWQPASRQLHAGNVGAGRSRDRAVAHKEMEPLGDLVTLTLVEGTDQSDLHSYRYRHNSRTRASFSTSSLPATEKFPLCTPKK